MVILLSCFSYVVIIMAGLSRETRLQIMLDQEELAAIDDWRFQHRMPSRAAAVRQLLNVGLQAVSRSANPAMRSQDFGLLDVHEGDAES
jgi:hypothetical protein